MSSMLNKSIKSGFKPKVARRNGTASASQNSERLSKTPAPTATPSQPPPPPAPSASPILAVVDQAPSVPGGPPSTERERKEQTIEPTAQQKTTEKGPTDQHQHTAKPAAHSREPSVSAHAAPANSNPPEPTRQVGRPSREASADRSSTAPQPTSVAIVASAAATGTRTRSRSNSASVRARARKPREPTASEGTTEVEAPQADNAANEGLQKAIPAPTPPHQAEEQSDASQAGTSRRKQKKSTSEESSGQANGIAVPAKKPRARRAAPLPGEEGYQSAAEKRAAAGAPKRPQKRKSPTEDEETPATETGEESTGTRARKRTAPQRQREVTPEDAENVEIDVTQVKMADLIKDMRVGKKFSLHDELMERERMKRQKYKDKKQQATDTTGTGQQDGALGSGTTPAADLEPPSRTGPSAPAGETYQIIDGVIVVDSRSLQVDRHARAAEEAGEMEEHEENEFTHHTTSATYLRRNMRPKQWADDETDKFYWALSMFGTDFETIAKMFPGKTRKHVKLKFNREERTAPARIQAALVGQKTVGMDMDEYKRLTGAEYETAEAIYAEQKKAEEEFEARQKAIQDEKEEQARKRKEELFGSGPGGGNKNGENPDEAGNKKKKGRGGGKKKRAEATW